MQNAQQREFFNLHTSGLGYLSRIRWVTPTGRGRKSEPFLACAISALRGSSDQSETTYFDLRVSGEEAISLIEGMQESVNQRRKVCVTFRIADTYAHGYERDVCDPQTRLPTRKKEWTALIKGRLILIYSISVDGKQVYRRQAEADQASGAPQGAHHEDWQEEGRTEQDNLGGAPEFEPQHAGQGQSQNEEPQAPRLQRPAPAQRQDFAPNQERGQPQAPRQGGAPQERYQPRQAAAPAARGNGPSAGHARRPAPHSGAGYQQQRAGHA